MTRDNHERVDIYDWMLDLDMNEDWRLWAKELRA
jgi:hypothetical protein